MTNFMPWVLLLAFLVSLFGKEILQEIYLRVKFSPPVNRITLSSIEELYADGDNCNLTDFLACLDNLSEDIEVLLFVCLVDTCIAFSNGLVIHLFPNFFCPWPQT